MYNGQFLIDQFINENFFKNKKDGFFVECGATDGVLESTCKFFGDYLNWKGINIEPSPPLFEMLKANRPNSINLNIGLSNEKSNKTFTHAIHPTMGNKFGNGSFTHHPTHKADLINQGCSFKNYIVQCDRFSNVFNYYVEIDLFVLDVEGHEIQALEGIIDIDEKFMPKVFCIEHSFSGLENIKKLLPRYKLHSLQAHNAMFLKD